MDKYSLFFSLVNVHNNVLKVSVILIEVSQTHKYMVWNMKALFFLLSSLSPIIPLPLAGSSCSFRECPSWPFLPLVTFHMHYSAEWLLFVCLFVFNLVSSPRDLSCCELFLSWASVLFHHHTTDGRHGLPPLLSCSVWPRAVYSHLSGMLFTGSLQDLQWPLCFPGLCGRPLAYDHRWPQVPRDTGKPTPPPIFHHRHTLLAHYQSLPAP